jgi:hypothetical protein
MMRHNQWLKRQLLVGLVVVVASGPAASTTASAHAGNSDPSVIHACVNGGSGLTRIVGVTGSCTAGEDPTHWGIVGPRGPQGPQGSQGPQGPPGTVASFDDLAGLPCTRDGSVGTTTILYASNGDATLRCVLPQPPPPAGLSGTYSISPELHLFCGLPLPGFDIMTFVFTPLFANVLQVDGAPATMLGTVSGNTFNVTGSNTFSFSTGTVVGTYTLAGVFDLATGTWNGTFHALFEGAGVDPGFPCADQSFSIQGTRL